MILEDRFKQYVKTNNLFKSDEKILLTVSGGVDSMVMLKLFATCGYDIGVAHCNFQLRGEESEEDEVSVQNQAQKLGVPFYNRRFDTKGEMERTGESMEMAARRIRYEWFNSLCREENYDAIAIAHHADDSIETFFINMLRGTGLKGLTGISVVNGKIIRPLMFASRKEILEYAIANKIPYREDSSNRSTKYLRNKIRLGIVPRLREIAPKFTDIMCKNIKRLTEAQLFIDRTIEVIRNQVIEHCDGEDIIIPQKIDSHYPINFVIYELMSSGYGFKGDVIDSLCQSLHNNSTGKRFYSRDYVAYIDRGTIIIEKIQEHDDCEVEIVKGQQKVYCGNSVLYIEYHDIDNIEVLVQPENVALIDADLLTFPIKARRWQDGDWFIPLGMNGKKKISDFLIDTKVPMSEKERQFVLTNGEDIVWLIGRRLDDRYKIRRETENVLKITKEII